MLLAVYFAGRTKKHLLRRLPSPAGISELLLLAMIHANKDR